MKRTVKILSVFCCVMLIVMPFSLIAYAENSNIVFDFVLLLAEKLVEQNFQMSDDANSLSPSEFRDKYSQNESYYDYMARVDGNGGIDAALATMSNADYLCATVNKSMLDKLKNSANSFLSDYYKDLRINTFEDFNLQTYDKVESQSGTFLGLSGSGSFVHYGTTFEGSYYDLQTEPTRGQIALYTGSNQSPWCMYVPEGSTLYQCGKKISDGKCWVLPLDYHIIAVLSRSSGSSLKFRWTSGSTIDDIYYAFEGAAFGRYCRVYEDGNLISNFDDLPQYISNYDFVSKLTNMINVRLTVNENDVLHANINLPSDIPYDNNNEVVVCVPVGGGDIIYYTPQTFNNYIDNGDIVYNNENYDNSRVESVVNNYNNYITNNNTTVNSTYDDSNLLNKLSGWFGDVNKNLKKIVDRLDTIIDTIEKFSSAPVYDNFSDCITKNVPLFSQLETLISAIGSGSVGIQKSDLNSSGATIANRSSSFIDGISVNCFGVDYEFVIDLGWYEPYRNSIREILKIGAYLALIGTVWRSVKSVFGISADTNS